MNTVTQIELFPGRPLTPVTVQCPTCGHVWLTAYLHPWGDKTAAQVAARCYCVACECQPPMLVAKAQKASAA